MNTLIESQLAKLKEIFLESDVKYKDFTLTDKSISIGQIPAIPSTPHINISWKSRQMTPEFTGFGERKTDVYDISFIIRSSLPVTQTDQTKLQNLTNDLNNFVTGYLSYLLNNYRYGSSVNDLWYMITQASQSELLRLENNNFMISINLNVINY